MFIHLTDVVFVFIRKSGFERLQSIQTEVKSCITFLHFPLTKKLVKMVHFRQSGYSNRQGWSYSAKNDS